MPKSPFELTDFAKTGLNLLTTFQDSNDNKVEVLEKEDMLILAYAATLTSDELMELGELISAFKKLKTYTAILIYFDRHFSPTISDSFLLLAQWIRPWGNQLIHILNPGALKMIIADAKLDFVYFPQNLAEALRFNSLDIQEKYLSLESQNKELLKLHNRTTLMWENSLIVGEEIRIPILTKPIVDYLDLPLWVINRDYQLVYHNSRFKKLYEAICKVSPELEAVTYLNLPDDFKQFIFQVYQVALEGSSVSKSYSIKIEGLQRHLYFTAKPLKDKNGKTQQVLIYARDNSNLVAAEQSAKDNQQLLIGLIGSLDEGIYSTDENLILKTANAAFYKIRKLFTGQDLAIGESILSNLPEERKTEIAGYYKKALSGQRVNYIKEIQTDNGIFIYKVRLRPHVNNEGIVTGIAGILQENTEEYLKDKLLKEEENRIKFLLENSTDVLVMVDEHDRIQYASPSIAQLYGYTTQEVYRKNSYAFIHPIDYEYFRKEVAKSIQNLQSNSLYTIRILHKSGKAVWSDLVIHRLYNDDGKLVRAIFNLREVSNRVEQEDNIRKNKKLLESISKNIQEGLYRSTPRNGLIYVNDAFREMFGYWNESLESIQSNQLYASTEDRERLLQLVMHQGFFQNEEVVFKRKDNTTFIAQISSIKTEEDNGEVFFDGVIRDITKQKQAEAILHQAKEAAEKANKLKAEFLASVSHEIRTPLNGVIGMTSLLKHSNLTEEQKDYVDTIKKSGDHLLSIINDILDFSKIESGYLLTENHPFELSVVLEETLDLFAAKAYEKSIELIIDVDDEVNEYFTGDSTRIRQVLVNLIGNAIKFTEKGEIIIKVSLDKQFKKDKEHQVKLAFRVSDTGIGIKEEDLNKLFKPFSQVDSSNTRKFGGTGLGLVISEKLVIAMGGEIKVESQYGYGTTFHFTILLEDHQQMSKREIDYSKLNGLSALVIDDNQTNLKIIERILSQKGMHIITTTNPVKGLDTLLQGGLKIDLLIIDMQMPEMDGLTLGRSIRRINEFEKIPMILFSSIGDFDTLNKDSQHVFNGVLTKPAKPSAILSKVMQVLYKETPIKHHIQESQLLNEAFAQRYPSRILIAEDNLINQKLIVKILEKMGYQPDVVANGLEVLEAVSMKKYDLIFMDVQMPEMDGLEATRHLVTKRMMNRPHVVAMTANALTGDRENCLAAGMHDYISKPVKIEEIQKMIIQWGRPNG